MLKKYNVGWGLTNCCNMNCQFCYSKQTRFRINEKKLEDWKLFIDQNHEFIDSINYGTGENSLVDDFFYLVKYIRENYPTIKQAVTSNGYLSEAIKRKPEFKDIFLKGIDEVDVSLDFVNKENHNTFRGQANAYDWALNLLQLLKETKKTTTIVFIGCEQTLNKNNIDGLFEIAKRYNAILRMNIYRPVSTESTINDKFIVSYNSLTKILEYINSKYQIISLNDSLFSAIYLNESFDDNTGINSIRILPDGSICPSTYLISEDYRNKYSISDENVLSKIDFKNFTEEIIPENCKDCKYRNLCKGGVKDRRILWHKSLSHRDPYCPIKNCVDFPTTKVKVCKEKRISVHDGYLPTIFFKNKDQ